MTAAAVILIVDDERQNCRLLEALLVPEGYDTRTATSGEEALVSIADDPPDLILLDVMMPGLDGRQVASAVKADPATANIPIIMVTAQTDREARLAGLEAGAEDFLTKPVDRAELWLRVRNLLRLKELGDLLEHHRGTLEAEVAARTAELQEAFEAARSMIESSLDALVAISAEGLITDANEATVKATGVPRQELIGTAFSECFTEPEKANAIYELVFEQGMAVDYPLTMRHRDGTLTEVLYNASVYRDVGEKVLGVFAAARDVTEARQAFEAARSMIESSLDALVAISAAGLITDANEATVKATGVPRVELIGTAFSDCFTDPEKANAIYQLVFEQGMAVDYPLTMRHRDGTLTEVLYNASVYRDGGGKVLGVFAAARDVTNQNQAHIEIARQQATALTRLAELEQFHRLTVGRELKMIELKKENEYLRKLGPGDGGEQSGTY
jgi:PAS domain S-box-containing protein